jgi:cyanophycinase-like exopeptidase
VNTANVAILPQPGLIILFGSGETSPTGRKIFEEVFDSLPCSPRLALLETPAGFELNSHQVIGRVADFFRQRLQNFTPQVEIIPARKRGTPFSPDEPDIVVPLLRADLIFMGPGSPSYAIRQLRDSLAWYYLIARHRLGGVLALASAATVAFSSYALPVYEIYKVGEELHWIEGLDFFKQYGLNLVFIPHWNNREGGAELDTSRCFMGRERFAYLTDLLPAEMTVIGLDEKTALIMDPANSSCQVKGLGNVTLIHTGHKHPSDISLNTNSGNFIGSDRDLHAIAESRAGHFHQYRSGQVFSMNEIGHFHACHPEATLPTEIWQKANQVLLDNQLVIFEKTPAEVLRLIEQREIARQAAKWSEADGLRNKIASLGWEVIDSKNGPLTKKLVKS